jgi:hypothetical protein
VAACLTFATGVSNSFTSAAFNLAQVPKDKAIKRFVVSKADIVRALQCHPRRHELPLLRSAAEPVSA